MASIVVVFEDFLDTLQPTTVVCQTKRSCRGPGASQCDHNFFFTNFSYTDMLPGRVKTTRCAERSLNLAPYSLEDTRVGEGLVDPGTNGIRKF